MAIETQILANRRNAQVMVLSFLRRQESRVLGVPGFRIKCGMTARNVPTKSCAFMQNKANFRKSQVDVRPLVIMNYERKSNWTLGENEPKTNPIKANLHLTAENAEYAEKKDIFVSDCPIEKYALYPISPCSLRTWRLMKNKPNSNPISEKPKMNVTSATTVNYINELRTTNYELIMKNKANQSQFQNPAPKEREEKKVSGKLLKKQFYFLMSQIRPIPHYIARTRILRGSLR